MHIVLRYYRCLYCDHTWSDTRRYGKCPSCSSGDITEE